MLFDSSSRGIRVCVAQAVLLASIALAPAAPTIASPVNPIFPRVRSSSAFLRALMVEAVDRSRTFRRLVETIEGTDGIVYVEPGTCGHGVRACLTMSVTLAGRYRILRVLIDTRQEPPDLMASIGHELRHAIEVLENRAVVNPALLYLFYSQGKVSNERPFETRTAIEAGFAVRNEVGSSLSAARQRLQK